MLFNSFDFIIFYCVIVACYYAMGRLPAGYRWQNGLLFVGSIYFYAYWDYRFVGLLLFSILMDFSLALGMHRVASHRTRCWLMVVSLVGNLGLLGTFKYLNFFIESAAAAMQAMGFEPPLRALNIILPVGISFYTFQSLSYTIDVYRGRIEPTTSFFDFALFVMFFPQLVAGPIERASSLVPQIQSPRSPRRGQIADGLHLILWGIYKKVFVADSLARLVDPLFRSSDASYSGLDVLLVLYAYAFQIYCDFSGYTDIARGVCKTLGFELMLNFDLPYFATNPSEFWRRWHISLSSWLREYLYFSLGGNRCGTMMTYRNLFLTMLLGGLWHGAQWNFVIWGAFHGGLLCMWHALGRRQSEVEMWPTWVRAGLIAVMFHVTCVGWLFFRAQWLGQIADFLGRLCSRWSVTGHTTELALGFVSHSWLLLVVQAWQYLTGDLNVLRRQHAAIQISFYTIIVLGILATFARPAHQFIYFQF